MKKPFIVVIIAIVWFLGTVGIIATLGGCSTWTNYIHEQAQEEYRQDLDCQLLDKTFVPCSEIEPL